MALTVYPIVKLEESILNPTGVPHERCMIAAGTTLYAVLLIGEDGQTMKVYKSEDNGQNWSEVADDYLASDARIVYAVFDGDDTIHISWRPESSTAKPRYRTFSISTETFSAEEELDVTVGSYSKFARLVLDSSGIPHMFAGTNTAYCVYTNRSGGSWAGETQVGTLYQATEPMMLSEDSFFVVMRKHNTAAVWHKRTSGGAWTSGEIAAYCYLTYMYMAKDPNSDICYMMHQEATYTLRLSTRDADGNWTLNETITGDVAEGGAIYGQAVFVDTDGIIYAIFKVGDELRYRWKAAGGAWSGTIVLPVNANGLITGRMGALNMAHEAFGYGLIREQDGGGGVNEAWYCFMADDGFEPVPPPGPEGRIVPVSLWRDARVSQAGRHPRNIGREVR